MRKFATGPMGINDKFRYFAVGAMLAFVIVSPGTLFADTGTWVDGDLPVLTIGDPIANIPSDVNCFPTSFTYHSYTNSSGSFDSIGRDISTPVCATQNSLGFFGGSGSSDNYGFVKPNTSYAFSVFDARINGSSATPVPNQATFITKDSSQSFNGEVAPHFYDSFPSAGTFGPAGQQLAFTVNQPGTILTDSAGTKIYMHAYAFSQNGQWMVLEARGLGLVRVNTQTREMQLFDPIRLTYGQGYRPSMTLAISDDGNFVIRSGKDAGDPVVYDLSGCQAGSFTIGAANTAAMQGCRSRGVYSSLRAQLPNFAFLANMHFGADGKSVSVVAASTGLNGALVYYQGTYAVAGYQKRHTTYIALGDSFSSGEGAYDYEPGTNNSGNLCHLSKLSYPYLAAAALGVDSFHSVACSGATTLEYSNGQKGENKVQGSTLGDWIPGYQGQGKFFNLAGSTSIVTISMIGNDIGFKDKLLQCLAPNDTCFHFQDDRKNIANEIYNAVATKLFSLYNKIPSDAGNPNVKVYVMGYPQIMGTGPACPLNVPFSQEERQMAQGLISYLDATIKTAALDAGFQYIDDQYAFAGHMLCEDGEPAVNGLAFDSSVPDLLSKLNASFHPNTLGHQLMSQDLLSQSENFTKPMPAAKYSMALPYTESPEYAAFVTSAPQGGTLSHLVYEGTGIASLVLKATDLPISVNDMLLQSNSVYNVWFNSAPVLAGTITSDGQGQLHGEVPVPDGLDPGYHMVHILGKDVSGQDIDMYHEVYVAASADDYNGDGVPNNQDPCLLIPASGIDQDKDGIDDACDPVISAAPADTVAPGVTGVADRQPDHDGWYTHDVTINWTAADPDPSSGAPSRPAATIADQIGDNVYTSGPSCDPAGNCATGSLELKLDQTAPDITFTIDPAPNVRGWNKNAATVTFSCADATSGVASCTSPVTISKDSNGYIVTGTAVDNAGNSSSVNVVVALDSTAPTVTSSVTPAPNQNGWNNSDVTVTPTCSDTLSGIVSCSAPTTLTSEGASQTVTNVAEDNAGNLTTATTTVNIDKTAPAVLSMQWGSNPKATTQTTTLTVRANDALSGVVHAEYYLGNADPGPGNGATLQPLDGDFVASMGTDFPTGVYKVTVRAEDMAGNWSSTSSDFLVVYNPFSIRMTGKRFVQPSLVNSDKLPGLVASAQSDLAKFAFTLGYDAQGKILPNSDFQFSYSTGAQCGKPVLGQNCHNLILNASALSWFTIQSPGNNTGVAEGSATLVVDGAAQQVTYVLTGLDGEAFSATSSDHLKLAIYKAGDNPATAAPLYQADDDVARGNIRIKT